MTVRFEKQKLAHVWLLSGSRVVSGAELVRCECIGCNLASVDDPAKGTTFWNVRLIDSPVNETALGSGIFDEVLIRNVRTSACSASQSMSGDRSSQPGWPTAPTSSLTNRTTVSLTCEFRTGR